VVTMHRYITVNIDKNLHHRIKELVNEDGCLYRTMSEFVHATLREKILELGQTPLLEKKVGSLDGQHKST